MKQHNSIYAVEEGDQDEQERQSKQSDDIVEKGKPTNYFKRKLKSLIK